MGSLARQAKRLACQPERLAPHPKRLERQSSSLDRPVPGVTAPPGRVRYLGHQPNGGTAMGRRIIAACALALAGTAGAHGGGLDKNGCHHDRKNGGYHCHRGGGAAPPMPRHDLGAPPPAQALRPSTGGTFHNCSDARAAGAAPVRRGDPGYGRHLDRDGDGVGCE